MTKDFPDAERINTGEVTLAVYRMGPHVADTNKPPLLFLHGFPEIAYSWRHVMRALAALGYPVIAPDLRGYGASDVPEAVSAYRGDRIVADLTGLLDVLDIKRAVAIGHDWGALILWMLPFYAPDRFLGYAGLNVAHTKPLPMDPVALFAERLGKDMYIVRFQPEGEAEAILERDVDATLDFFFRKPARSKADRSESEDLAFAAKGLDLLSLLEAGPGAWGGVPLLSEEERQPYVEAFRRSGFRGPLNYYRNMSANWQAQKRFLIGGALPLIEDPVLMITADLDTACPARLADGMPDLCSTFTRVDLQNCGHWSMQERPDDVIQAIKKWLSSHYSFG